LRVITEFKLRSGNLVSVSLALSQELGDKQVDLTGHLNQLPDVFGLAVADIGATPEKRRFDGCCTGLGETKVAERKVDGT